MNKDNCTVLFLDDESQMLRTIERKFRRESYKRIYAENAEAALLLLETEDVNVVVSDLCMPGMGGVAFLRKIREQYPDILTIVFSGNTKIEDMIDLINTNTIYRYLKKPLEREGELQIAIRQAIECSVLRNYCKKQKVNPKLGSQCLELKERVKCLEGMLAICPHCQKQQDLTGLQQKAGQYIDRYSNAELAIVACNKCSD